MRSVAFIVFVLIAVAGASLLLYEDGAFSNDHKLSDFTVTTSSDTAPAVITVSGMEGKEFQMRTVEFKDVLTGKVLKKFTGEGTKDLTCNIQTYAAVKITQTVTDEKGKSSTSSKEVVIDGTISKHYSWKYQVKTWYTGIVNINNRDGNMDLYLKFSDVYSYLTDTSHARNKQSDLQYYITPDDPYIKKIADNFKAKAKSDNLNDETLVNCVLKFVQDIEYKSDLLSKGKAEYYKYPVETLYEECGDCEDTTLLFLSIIHAMGYKGILIIFPDHACAAVAVSASGSYVEYGGNRYFYCETATEGSQGIVNSYNVGDKGTDNSISYILYYRDGGWKKAA